MAFSERFVHFILALSSNFPEGFAGQNQRLDFPHKNSQKVYFLVENFLLLIHILSILHSFYVFPFFVPQLERLREAKIGLLR